MIERILSDDEMGQMVSEIADALLLSDQMTLYVRLGESIYRRAPAEFETFLTTSSKAKTAVIPEKPQTSAEKAAEMAAHGNRAERRRYKRENKW